MYIFHHLDLVLVTPQNSSRWHQCRGCMVCLDQGTLTWAPHTVVVLDHQMLTDIYQTTQTWHVSWLTLSMRNIPVRIVKND